MMHYRQQQSTSQFWSLASVQFSEHLISCCQKIAWLSRKKIKGMRLFFMVATKFSCQYTKKDRLVGQLVKVSALGAEDPGFKSRLQRDFSGSSHTSDLKIGTPMATLPGAWHYRVSAGTGRPGVSILSLGEVESWICNFYLSVAARKIVWADPSLRYTSMLLGR